MALRDPVDAKWRGPWLPESRGPGEAGAHPGLLVRGA